MTAALSQLIDFATWIVLTVVGVTITNRIVKPFVPDIMQTLARWSIPRVIVSSMAYVGFIGALTSLLMASFVIVPDNTVCAFIASGSVPTKTIGPGIHFKTPMDRCLKISTFKNRANFQSERGTALFVRAADGGTLTIEAIVEHTFHAEKEPRLLPHPDQSALVSSAAFAIQRIASRHATAELTNYESSQAVTREIVGTLRATINAAYAGSGIPEETLDKEIDIRIPLGIQAKPVSLHEIAIPRRPDPS